MLKLRRSAMESAAGWRNTSDWLRKQEEEKEKEEKQEASGLKLRQSVIDEFGLGTPRQQAAAPEVEGPLGDFLDLLLDPLNTAKEGIEDVGTTTGNFLEQQKQGWFQKGAFERGEIGKGIAASGLDAAENVGGGFLDTGESFLDWLVGSALPGIAQGQYYQNGGGYNIQADQIAEQQIKANQPLRDELVKKDLYDGREIMKQGTEWLGGLMDIDVQQDSVFGDKMDSLMQSGGQMLGTTLLQAGGVPWWVTTGATAWGSEMENALNQGATHEEAAFSGMMSGAAEVLTEMISGGIEFGEMGTLDDGMTKLLARSITNKFWRNAAKVGLDILGEGTEEVLSEAIGRFGQWMSYQDDKTLEEMLRSEEAADSYITAFLGGAIMGGFGSGVQQVKSAVSGVDAVTGLTKNEQAVVDQVYREAVAQAETQGKVTEKQKAEIYDNVLESMEKGYIGTDMIEQVLGSNASELVKNDRLMESYRERSRGREAFQADLGQYTQAQRATVQRAMDSGLLNNTNRSHELVDFLAKLEADKGIVFDFTNNARLRETGFALEGVTVNGFVNTNGITLNISSGKALNTVVGHEIMHVLEGSGMYDSLAEAVETVDPKAFADRLEELTKLYSGREGYTGEDAGRKIRQEVVADLVGDYLFTDRAFVEQLSTEQPGVFRKAFEEIKYLCKVATRGSQQAKQLEKVKKVFTEIYRETDAKIPTGDGGVRYSIHRDIVDVNGKRYDSVVELDKRVSKSVLSNPKRFMGYIEKNLVGLKLQVFDASGNTEIIEFAQRNESTSKSGKSHPVLGELAYTKGDTRKQVIVNAREVIEESTHRPDRDSNENSHGWLDENGWENRSTYVLAQDGKIYEAQLRIAKTRDGRNLLYSVNLNINDGIAVDMGATSNEAAVLAATPSEEMVTQKEPTVNTKNSLSADGQVEDLGPVAWQVKGADVALADGAKDGGIATSPAAPRNDGSIGGIGTNEGDGRRAVEVADPYGETVEGPVQASGEDGNASEYEALFPSEEDLIEAEVTAMDDEYRQKAGEEGYSRTLYDSGEGKAVDTVGQRLQVKHQNLQWELEAGQRNRQQMLEAFDKKIASVQAKYDVKANKNTKIAQGLLRQIQRLQRLKSDRVAEWDKRLADIQSRMGKVSEQMQQDHSQQDRLETVRARIDRHLEADLAQLQTDFDSRRNGLTERIGNKTKFIKDRAMELYQELQNLKKGVKASSTLGFLKDSGLSWSQIKQGLATVYQSPTLQVNKGDTVESAVREVLLREYTEAEGQLQQLDTELETQRQALQEKAAQEKEAAGIAHQRKTKQGEYAQEVAELAGDTSTWKDKKMGISYMINTLRRNLREVVRDAEGNLDIEKADAIYDYLQGNYSRNEAELKRESRRIKSPYKDLHLTKAEDAYVQMLGEVRHNPDTSLNPLDVEAFYEAHKDSIDKAKVDKAIEMARKTYDELLRRVNEVLSAQGMKEIPYRKGYFPHFTEEKNGFLARLLNWKAKNNEIPTDIAGLTEQFNPNRSWQSFNKRRMSDTTDYSFTKGMDTYVQGALDWIYHIEDIQRRRAFENHIRYVHSDEGIQEKIDAAVNSHQYNADELQEEIDSILKEAGNPLNNLVTDLRTGTNLLAGKKSSMDRGMEQLTSRKAYSAMTNISNRVSANMVGGSISSALTNFIPITQSWGQVSPVSSLKALGQVIRNAYRDDGTVDKSTFLTNRLREDEKLYQSGWDKAGNVVNWFSGLVDSLTAQTVWRSKYMENLEAGMSENAAIRDADQFAENVIAGRSRGETPTIFGSKNPVTKLLTAFQLEVANQYGYMLKDMPQDLQKEAKGKLVAGYAKMFVGAYAYNALFSALTGRDAAFDPIRILEGLLGDLGVPGTMELLTGADDEEKEEPLDAMMGFAEDIAEEIPFIGGLLGGGRVPISSALPYEGDVMDTIEGAGKLLLEGDLSQLRELENPMYYLLPPMAGGQLRKTVQGLGMFYGDHPVPGSYTDSGDLRFTVEDNFFSKLKAGIFGQWASENAQAYIEEGRKPLSQQQTQELLDTGMTMDEYWTYRDGLKGLSTLAEKADYINGLDLTTEQKNILINNIADREDPIDMESYEDFGSFAEFDYAIKNPEKYAFLEESGIGYAAYAGADEEGKRAYTWAYDNPGKFAIAQAVSQDFMTFYSYKQTMSAFESDMDEDGNTISGSKKEKVIDYINSLDLEYGQKILLYRMMYDSQADKDTYNMDIIDYLNSREDISYEAMETILIELGFQVDEDGNITWD